MKEKKYFLNYDLDSSTREELQKKCKALLEDGGRLRERIGKAREALMDYSLSPVEAARKALSFLEIKL